MGFTRFQKNWDLKVLEKLTNFEIAKSLILELNSYAFTVARQPVKTRMDFAVVQRRLNRDEYSLVSDWICQLIWFNVKNCSRPRIATDLMIEQLNQWFEQRFQKFPSSEMDAWMMLFRKIQKSVKALMENHSFSSLTPSRFGYGSWWKIHPGMEIQTGLKVGPDWPISGGHETVPREQGLLQKLPPESAWIENMTVIAIRVEQRFSFHAICRSIRVQPYVSVGQGSHHLRRYLRYFSPLDEKIPQS